MPAADPISFIVPAHNEEHELPATLSAVVAAADEVARRYEVIVVDDDSSDATAEIARRFGARVEHVCCRQIAAVRNAGARVANGEVFFFVDADTHINTGALRAALGALERCAVGGGARLKLDRDVPLLASIFIRVFCACYFGAKLAAGAFIFVRRSDFEAVGGFDEQYFAGEEVYLTLALRKRGAFVILKEPVTTSARKVRMHSGGALLRQWFALLFGGKRVLRQRERLDVWYDGKREQRAS